MNQADPYVRQRFRQRGRVFDLVIVDTPPFSNVKGSVFSALRDYGDLIAAIAPVVAIVGVLSNPDEPFEYPFILRVF